MGLFTLDKDLLPENWKKSGPSGKPVLREPPEVGSKEPVYLVTDTSWWMEQGWRDGVRIAEKVPEAFFVVPAGVMRELDGLKKNAEKGRRALEAIKRIEELVRKGRARIETKKSEYYNALASKTDEEVVGVAKKLKEEAEIFLLTTDRAQIALAKQLNIKVKIFEEHVPLSVKIIIYLLFLPLLPVAWIFNKLLKTHSPGSFER